MDGFVFASGISPQLFALTMVVVLAIAAQWFAWRFKVPAILLLLSAGFVAGPVTGFLNPKDLVRDEVLFPIVGLSVALILFEGGLTLKLSELKESGGPIRNLCSIGAAITGFLATTAAYFFLGTGIAVSLILGCMLVVTGPTVIGPMLRHIRPSGRVSTIAKWEGIVIDPVGATLGVLALAAVEAAELGTGGVGREVIWGLVKTIFWGSVIGASIALSALYAMRRFWIPDHLENPVLLMLVMGCFTLSNYLQDESGLLAVTLMGLIMVNQKSVSLKHIIEFKENLRVLLISFLFIVLAARIRMETLDELGWGSVVFVAMLMLVIRPVSVWASTIGSGLSWRERLFLSWLAPRGIVAAALASVFAVALYRLEAHGLDEPVWLLPGAVDKLEPITFLVIVVTVSVYGLTAGPLARALGLAAPDPQGILFASAHSGARAISKAVQDAGFAVLMVDNNRENVRIARMEGLPAEYANILSEHILEVVDFSQIGRLVSLTRNDEVNSLAAMHFSETFGRANVYQLVSGSEGSTRKGPAGEMLKGRRLFREGATYEYLDERFESGAVVKKTKLTAEFDYTSFRELYGQSALVLFVITAAGKLIVNTAGEALSGKAGDAVIALVDAPTDK